MKKVFGAVLATAALALGVSCTTVAPGYGFATQAVVPDAASVKMILIVPDHQRSKTMKEDIKNE